MSEILIVRVNEKLIPDFQIQYKSKNNTAQKAVLKSWSDITQSVNQELVLILAAELVLNTQVNIPSKSDEVIRQSIPFAIEEVLASDVNNNHCAYQNIKENLFLVSVVSHEIMSKIIQLLKNYNLKCDQLYSELFTIPTLTDQLSVLNCGQSLLINENFHKGTRIHKKSFATYLQISKQKKGMIFSDQHFQVAENVNFNVKKTPTAQLQAHTLCTGKYVNLFQGTYQSGDKELKQSNPWKSLLILISVLVVSWLSISFYQLWNLNAEISENKNKQLMFLSEVIPNANQTQRNDPYASIQSFLKRTEQANGTHNSSGLMTPLYYLGKTLNAYPDLQLQSLRKRDNKLEVKLLAPDVTVLNKFQMSLDKNAISMRVRIGTRDSSKNGIVSIITMEQLR